ncbi:MAG: L-asparaginase [Cellvibrionaceae bacterium]|jgi:L-asparaginase
MLTIFTTGGTFDKIYFDANSEFSIGEPQVKPILKEANLSLDYHIESLLKKDSLDIGDVDRQLIVDKIVSSDSRQIIITHGTDGMAATAQAIAKASIETKTIVLVGAMQPARMRYSDAPFNLGFAVASALLLPAGIYISMNGHVFTHDNVTKNLAQARFESLS